MGFTIWSQIEVAETVRNHAIEKRLMVPYLFPHGIRKGLPPRSKRDFHEILRVAHRQRPEHERIHETEDRGIRADAERESGDYDEREAGTPAEIPQCMLEIAADLIQ
jgi:hypothetical protein